MTFYMKVKGKLHCDVIIFDRGPPVPLVIHQRLIGFANVEPQIIVIAPCDEALYPL